MAVALNVPSTSNLGLVPPHDFNQKRSASLAMQMQVADGASIVDMRTQTPIPIRMQSACMHHRSHAVTGSATSRTWKLVPYCYVS